MTELRLQVEIRGGKVSCVHCGAEIPPAYRFCPCCHLPFSRSRKGNRKLTLEQRDLLDTLRDQHGHIRRDLEPVQISQAQELLWTCSKMVGEVFLGPLEDVNAPVEAAPGGASPEAQPGE